jgi:hypothetical protein
MRLLVLYPGWAGAKDMSREHPLGQGTTHRDLKPANIKVRLDGTVKVTRLRPREVDGAGLDDGCQCDELARDRDGGANLLTRWR